MKIIILDTETTDLGDNARLIQLAYKNMETGDVVDEFFKPPVPISYGALATHHTTEKMLADKPEFISSKCQKTLIKLLKNGILVAHNALFDINILKNEGVKTNKYIDTLRVSMHTLESEQYKLQYLRYALKLDVEGLAHNALGDIAVLESLFEYLKNTIKNKFSLGRDNEIIEKMLELTQSPIMLKVFAFGKYKGKTFEDVASADRGYLEWLYDSEFKKPQLNQNEELIYTLKEWLHL